MDRLSMTRPGRSKLFCAIGVVLPLLFAFFARCAAGNREQGEPDVAGVVVESLAPGSPAAASGLLKGDGLLRWALPGLGEKGEFGTILDWEALQLRYPDPIPLELRVRRGGREMLFKIKTASEGLVLRPPLAAPRLSAYRQAQALIREGKNGAGGDKLAEISVIASENKEKKLSLWLKLQAVSPFLRDRRWDRALQVYGEALAGAKASGDPSLRCVALQKAWAFYFLVRRQRVSFTAAGLKLSGTFYDIPGWTRRQAVILSHGSSAWGQNHPFVVMTALELARLGHEVFTFDYRGFGASQDPADLDDPAAFDFASDLSAAIDRVRIREGGSGRPIVLLGHSFGAGPTLACGYDHPAVTGLVVVGPPRRVRQRNLDAAAPRGIGELRRRMKASMELDRLPGAAATREITERLLIDHFAGRTFDRPLLLIDGERERPELRRFLAGFAATLKGPVTYLSLPGAGHYFGLDAFRDHFPRARGGREEIGLEVLARTCGEWCDRKLDLALFLDYVARIDSWLGRLRDASGR